MMVRHVASTGEIMALSEFVKETREARGLTQRELARLSGVSIGAIRNIEQGMVKTLRLETAGRIARVLRVSVDRMWDEAREGQLEPAVA
jgi:transcriptional regulator with XRE-family HTH domain